MYLNDKTLSGCSKIKNRTNLGNASLKQGKRFNKGTSSIFSNQKPLEENQLDSNGFIIENFEGGFINTDDQLLLAPKVKKLDAINNVSISRNASLNPLNGDLEKPNVLNNNNESKLLKSLEKEMGMPSRQSIKDAGFDKAIKIREINAEFNEKMHDAEQGILKRNEKEDPLFNRLNKKRIEYEKLRNKKILNGQLNNSNLTKKANYLHFIAWGVAALTMGTLVIRNIMKE